MVRVVPGVVRVAFAMLAGCFMDATPAGESATASEGTDAPSSSGDEEGPPGSGPEGGGVTTDDDGSTGAVATCPVQTECIVIPPGWEGPYVVAEGDVACPADASALVETLHADLNNDVDCGCECGDAIGTCTANMGLVGSDPECTTPFMDVELPPGHCGVLDGNTWAIITTFATGTGMCTASAPTNEPSVTWARHATMCVAPDSAACEGGTCVPEVAAPFEDVCIVRDGSQACPPEWTVGSSMYVEAADTRVCACVCDSPAGADCVLGLDVFNDTQCAELYYESAGASCHRGIDTSPWSLMWMPVSAGSCTPQQLVSGELTPTAERTLCCRD